MTPCPSQKRLADLMEDRLDDSERTIIEEHLGDCAVCQEVLEELSVDVTEWSDIKERLRSDEVVWPTPTHHGFPGPDTTDWPIVPGFEIQGVLGKGGMGVVYRARQSSLNRVVALKMLRSAWENEPELRKRFLREAQALGKLQHPNIVRIFDILELDGRLVLVLELVEGYSLADRLREGILDPSEAARTLEVIARAMHHAHQAGFLHRDAKPSNILIHFEDNGSLPTDPSTPSPNAIKITDFGLVRHLDASNDTQTGAVLGTPSYMAPEQAWGESELTAAVDIYSLGAILYEMMVGKPPFTASTTYETLRKVVEEEPIRPSKLQRGLPTDLETICLKCIAKSPAQRYPDALELAEDLRRFQLGEPIHAHPPSLWTRFTKRILRHPVTSGLLLLLLLVVGLGLFFWGRFTVELHSVNADLEHRSREATENAERAQHNEGMTKLKERLAIVGLLQMEETLWAQYAKIRADKTLSRPEMAETKKKLAEEMLESISRLFAQFSGHPELFQRRARGYRALAKAHEELSNAEKAGRFYQLAVRIHEGLELEETPGPKRRELLGFYQLEYGTHLYRSKRFDEAKKQLLEAKRFLEGLTENKSSPTVQQALATIDEGLRRIEDLKP